MDWLNSKRSKLNIKEIHLNQAHLNLFLGDKISKFKLTNLLRPWQISHPSMRKIPKQKCSLTDLIQDCLCQRRTDLIKKLKFGMVISSISIIKLNLSCRYFLEKPLSKVVWKCSKKKNLELWKNSRKSLNNSAMLNLLKCRDSKLKKKGSLKNLYGFISVF